MRVRHTMQVFCFNTKPPCSGKHLDLISTDEAGRRDQGLLKLIVQSVSSRRPPRERDGFVRGGFFYEPVNAPFIYSRLTCARTISARLHRLGAIILIGSKNLCSLNGCSWRVRSSNIVRQGGWNNLIGWNQNGFKRSKT